MKLNLPHSRDQIAKTEFWSTSTKEPEKMRYLLGRTSWMKSTQFTQKGRYRQQQGRLKNKKLTREISHPASHVQGNHFFPAGPLFASSFLTKQYSIYNA
jgi:hypothetical protein